MRYYRRVTSAILALCAVIFLAGCSRSKETAAGETKAALTVTLISPSVADWPDQITASGRIAAWQESLVGAEVGGLRLEEVLVNVGDRVTKGQLLARFSAETTRNEVAHAEAALVQAEANLDWARDQADRARRLDNSGTISREEVSRYQSSEKSSAALQVAAKAQLESQLLKLRYTEVIAPDDGVISSRTATVGAVVNVGTELFRLIRQGRLEWRATVSGDSLSRIVPGQTVTLRPAGQPAVIGRVRQIAPTVDTKTLDGIIYVDLPEAGSLRAGMFVSGDIQFGNSRVLFVPESGVVYRDGYQYLMRVDGSRHVHQVKIATGRRIGQSVEILGETVATEDRFIASGGSFLNEGDKVEVASETAGAVPAHTKGERP